MIEDKSADNNPAEKIEKKEFCNDNSNKQLESQYLEEIAPGIDSTNTRTSPAVTINHIYISLEDIPPQNSRGYAKINFQRKAWHECHYYHK